MDAPNLVTYHGSGSTVEESFPTPLQSVRNMGFEFRLKYFSLFKSTPDTRCKLTLVPRLNGRKTTRGTQLPIPWNRKQGWQQKYARDAMAGMIRVTI